MPKTCVTRCGRDAHASIVSPGRAHSRCKSARQAVRSWQGADISVSVVDEPLHKLQVDDSVTVVAGAVGAAASKQGQAAVTCKYVCFSSDAAML